jgi:hypothetical protein
VNVNNQHAARIALRLSIEKRNWGSNGSRFFTAHREL